MSKYHFKEKAMQLRKKGYTYSDILKKIKVSKSTLSYWLSSVDYVPNEKAKLRINKARLAGINTKRNLRLSSIAEAKKNAKKDVGQMNKRDLFMLGLGLYIGEGTKTHGITRVVNSNPKIIRFMVKWFKSVCGLSNENFRLRIHLYPDNNIKESIDFWSSETGIPARFFQTSKIDTRSDKKKIKKGKLPFGTAHLSVRSNGQKEFGVFLFRKICAWIDEVLI